MHQRVWGLNFCKTFISSKWLFSNRASRLFFDADTAQPSSSPVAFVILLGGLIVFENEGKYRVVSIHCNRNTVYKI